MVFLTARAALEDNYSKALAKLAKNSLVVDGECGLAPARSNYWGWRPRT